MKKTIIISTIVGILCFVLGTMSGWHGCMSYNRSNKTEIVKAQDAALKAADKVMDNNQLFDTDGSDAMADYLQKAAVVDSLNNLENQGLCSSLSKQLRNKFFLHSREIVENTVNYRYCGHMTRAISRLIL